MLGLMQDWPLLCHRVIDHAATNHGDRAGDHALDRRADPPHQLSPKSAPAPARRATARPRRHQARRPRGDAGLEHLAAPGKLVRHSRHRRHLSHRQSAAVPRADRLDRQSRRRPRDDDRSHLRAAAGKARRQAADRSSATSCSPMRPTCRRRRCATRCPTRNGSPRSTATSPGKRSTKIPPPACATPPAPPAIPRACSIRIARTCCTPCCRCSRTRSGFPRATSSCRSCRCSTPMAGGSPSPRRWPARRWSCRAPSSTAPRSTSCSTTTRSPAPPRCRRCGCCCCSIWKRPAASCPISSAW